MLEKSPVTQQDAAVLPGFIIKPEMYAHILWLLTDNTKAYIASLKWQTRFSAGRKEYAAVCGAETPLSRVGDNGKHELLIPDFDSLQSILMVVFYHDDSVLRLWLGNGDRAVVVKHGANDEARKRVGEVRKVLAKRRIHPDGIVSIVTASVFFAVAVLLLAIDATLAAIIAAGGSVIAASVFFGLLNSGGGLRPRPSRIGQGWAFIGFTKEDLRRLITALVAGLIVFGFGLWLGRQ